MLRLSLQLILRNQKPPVISTPTPPIPAKTLLVTVITREILQIHNFQPSMKNIRLLPLRKLHPVQPKCSIIFRAQSRI